jgi:hypothetical protein
VLLSLLKNKSYILANYLKAVILTQRKKKKNANDEFIKTTNETSETDKNREFVLQFI